MHENVTEKAIWDDKLILKNCFFSLKSRMQLAMSAVGGMIIQKCFHPFSKLDKDP